MIYLRDFFKDIIDARRGNTNPPPRLPVAGETWYPVDGSPWPVKQFAIQAEVRVLACQDGWVMLKGSSMIGHTERRLHLKDFLADFHHEPVRLQR